MAVLLGSQSGFIDPQRLTKIRAVLTKIDQLYQSYASTNKIAGCSYAVVVDGNLIHCQSRGYADVAKKIPVTAKTVFRIASLSKSFTAMAILKLRDAGKLCLDDKVELYISEIRGQKLTQDSPPITIRDLLTHAAGLPQDDPWGDRKLSDTTADFLDLFKKGLHFSNATGVDFEYSNLGYTILGYIVSKVSKVSFQEYISENIWQPLGMHSAAWEYTKIPTQDLAHGYRWEADHWIEEPILHDGAFACMGGVMMSIEDFSKYVALHQSAWPPRDEPDDGPVCRAILRSMQRAWIFDQFVPNYKLLDGSELGYSKGYGYGLAWICDSQAKVYAFHPGSLPGFHAHWMMLPDYGVAVIVMGNIKNAPRFDVNMQALNTLVKEAGLQTRTLEPSPLLVQRQQEMIKLLPEWKNAVTSGIFAPNFFLDNSLEKWQQQTKALLVQAGKIINFRTMIPENQLRGHCIIECEKAKLKLKFTLAPEKPALIQEAILELMA